VHVDSLEACLQDKIRFIGLISFKESGFVIYQFGLRINYQKSMKFHVLEHLCKTVFKKLIMRNHSDCKYEVGMLF
jgi:hypothetical protein